MKTTARKMHLSAEEADDILKRAVCDILLQITEMSTADITTYRRDVTAAVIPTCLRKAEDTSANMIIRWQKSAEAVMAEVPENLTEIPVNTAGEDLTRSSSVIPRVLRACL